MQKGMRSKQTFCSAINMRSIFDDSELGRGNIK
jgi:hypothetical protein